ncbi:MAG: hypothetical protein QM765_10830 [Myxococcales bacterium]
MWRVLLLGMIAGLLIAGLAAFFYFRGRDAHPAPPPPVSHGPTLKEFGSTSEEPDRSAAETFEDAVEFSKKK